jgi:hypothetical protein
MIYFSAAHVPTMKDRRLGRKERKKKGFATHFVCKSLFTSSTLLSSYICQPSELQPHDSGMTFMPMAIKMRVYLSLLQHMQLAFVVWI